MKFIKYLSPILFIISLFGCEEVIQVDLNSQNPQVVIEGNMTNIDGQKIVSISKSTDFYNPGVYENVSGANVEIINSDGEKEILSELEPGKYIANGKTGEQGKEYSLNVIINGDKFTAKSKIELPLMIDSISVEKENRRPNNDKLSYILHVYFQDIPDLDNYARFNIFLNNFKVPGFPTYNDRLTDGKYIDWQIDFNVEKVNIPQITLRVELLTLDEPVYNYFKTLQRVNASGGSGGRGAGSVSPANPTSNISNSALGYFSAHSKSVDSLSIKINQ